MTSEGRECCPFCGSAQTQMGRRVHLGVWHWVECGSCCARGPLMDSAKKAANTWNTRLDPEEPAQFDRTSLEGVSLLYRSRDVTKRDTKT